MELSPAPDADLDLGLLALFDGAPLDGYAEGAGAGASAAREAALERTARAGAQRIVDALFALPIQRDDEVGPLAVLPPARTRLPRQQHVPRPKPLTRWQKFALAKGINKKRKDGPRAVDERTGEPVPRWGFQGRAGAGGAAGARPLDKDWLIEAKKTDDPTVDLFERKQLLKKKRVLENEIARAGNAQRAAYDEEKRAGGGASAGAPLRAERPAALGSLGAGRDAKAGKKRRRDDAAGGAAGVSGVGKGAASAGAEVRAMAAAEAAKRADKAARRDEGVLGGRVPAFVPSGIPHGLTMAEGAADSLSGNGKKARPAPHLVSARERTERRDERLQVAQASTMSLGRFDAPVEGEPERRVAKRLQTRLPNEAPAASERARSEQILKRLLHGEGEGEGSAAAGAAGGAQAASFTSRLGGPGAGTDRAFGKKKGGRKEGDAGRKKLRGAFKGGKGGARGGKGGDKGRKH